jgi:hypothetical protein
MSNIVEARRGDLDNFAEILAQAFRRESFVSSYLHPKPIGYPEDNYHEDLKRYWRRTLRTSWYDRRYHFLSIRSEGCDESNDSVLAIAVWKLQSYEQGVCEKLFLRKLLFHDICPSARCIKIRTIERCQYDLVQSISLNGFYDCK